MNQLSSMRKLKVKMRTDFFLTFFVALIGLATCENDAMSSGHCPDGWSDATFVDMGCLLFNRFRMSFLQTELFGVSKLRVFDLGGGFNLLQECLQKCVVD